MSIFPRLHLTPSPGNPTETHGAQPWSLAPGTQVAGFTVEGLLASGSFGTVYRAVRDGKSFAIKMVPMHARSEREVDALRRAPQHPNVVGFHGYGLWPDENPQYLVLMLQLVEGPPVDVWAREKNPTAFELVDQVLLPLALTLAEVHVAGVVHRDVKEANILMRKADGQPVLVDFGAAVYEGAPRLTQRLPPGTAEYRSPELLRFAKEWEGEYYPAQPGDDLWALGVTAYALLTGALPFGERNEPGMVRAILDETPVPPHERNPRVPRALSDVCMRMLEKDSRARYADGEALAEVLEEALDKADDTWRIPLFPAAERPKQQTPAAPRLPAPRRWHIGFAVTVALLVLGGVLLFATWGIRRPGSTPPSPTEQASSRQELAPAETTGEVARGAEPPRSPIPAPVAHAMNSEVPSMKKKSQKTTRALLAATCLAGSGCATVPKSVRPPPADCPPGSEETYERFKVPVEDAISLSLTPLNEGMRYVTVRSGEVSAISLDPMGLIPKYVVFSGRFFVGKDRVYGRFTQVHLPGGETVPVCVEVLDISDSRPGRPTGPHSTDAKVELNSTFEVVPMWRFR